MNTTKFALRQEAAEDFDTVEHLALSVFGAELPKRAAYHLRLNTPFEPELSFAVEHQDKIVGTVRVTKVRWGEDVVLMLGPLVVLPEHEGQGIGRMLMQTSVSAARDRVKLGEPDCIILVGNLSYYQPFGFERIEPSRIKMPKPTDPMRILACDLVPGSSLKYHGAARRLDEV